MIKSLKVKGWRSHKNSEFKFSGGTNVLVGVMGSGKSSILDALSFALFGTFPSLKSRKVTLDDIIMKRPKKKNKMKVGVTFEKEDNVYKIERKVERNKGTVKSEIRKNGEMLETGPSRTTEEVEKILKTDYELFSRAVYSEQDGLDYFLKLRKGQRMKRIDELLQIDKFENARSSTTSLRNRINDNIKDEKNMIKEMEEREDFGKIEEIEKEIKKLSNEKKDLEKEMKKIERKKEKINKNLEKMKKVEKKIKDSEKEKNMLSGKIKNLSEDVEKEGKIDIKNLEKKEKKLNEKLEKGKGKLKKIKEEFNKTSEKKQKINLEIESLVKKIENLKSIEGKCPICDRKLTEKHREKLIEERKEKIPKKEKNLKKSTEEVKKLKEKMKKSEEKIDKTKEKKYKLEERKEKAKKLKERKKKLKKSKEKMKKIEKKISKKKETFDEEKAEKLRKKLEELSGNYSEAKAKLNSNINFRKEKGEQLEKLKEKKRMFQKYKKKVKKMEILVGDLKKLEKALKETQVTLRREFVEAVNATMNRIWEHLYPYEDYTNIRLSIKERDYVLELKDPGGSWVPVEGMASGGERTTSALALRIAFALVLSPSLKWLVLDEPTHNLDERGKDYLSEVLREKIVEFIDQIFLITHDEKLENAVTGYLYKLERKKERNEPTKVELLSSPTN